MPEKLQHPAPGSNVRATRGRQGPLIQIVGNLVGKATKGFVLVFLLLFTIWSAGAFYFDLPTAPLRSWLPIVLLAWIAGCLWIWRLSWKGIAAWLASPVAVMLWWFTLQPTNDREWQPDVARLAHAEIRGTTVTIQNLRDFHYNTETSFVERWNTRTLDIGDILGIDLYITHWGVPLVSHVIVSFPIRNGNPLAFSIEARKTVGQEYSAIRGFYRQFQMIYLPAEERDVVRVRTNFRGEDVYLYRTLTTPKDAQALFLQYVQWINDTEEHPEWYNALTKNCVRPAVDFYARNGVGGMTSFDWRTVLSGNGDQMLYELGDLAGDLPFAELKKRALITDAAKNASETDFSNAIRAGRPGFTPSH